MLGSFTIESPYIVRRLSYAEKFSNVFRPYIPNAFK